MSGVSHFHIKKMQLLLEDPIVVPHFTLDGVKAGTIRINENGDVVLGRSRMGWKNRLFNSEFTISFLEASIRIAKAYCGTINRDDMLEFLKEFHDNVIAADKKENIIDMLLVYAMMYVKDSALSSKCINGENVDAYARRNSSKSRRYIGQVYADLGGNCMKIPLEVEM